MMKVFRILACSVLLVALTAPRTPGAQAAGPQDIQKSCTGFVQGFYDWYVFKALKEKKGSPLALALKQKGDLFSPVLFRRLKASDSAELDFDPFLNSQDPSERYVVGSVTVQRQTVLVEVYGMSAGKKNEKPDVVAELILRDGLWLFVNFHYGERNDRESEDLLSILEGLREGAQQHRK